jgi:hypothetical protein
LPFEYEEICTRVIDGDTFEVGSGHVIRLADVDTPEHGYHGFQEARDYVYALIYGKVIYLDLDDLNVYDTTGFRLVCVVYVEVEQDEYLNLNKALLDNYLADVTDYPNEFDPYSWSTRVYGIDNRSRMMIITFSFFTSLITVIILTKIKNRVSNLFRTNFMLCMHEVPTHERCFVHGYLVPNPCTCIAISKPGPLRLVLANS